MWFSPCLSFDIKLTFLTIPWILNRMTIEFNSILITLKRKLVNLLKLSDRRSSEAEATWTGAQETRRFIRCHCSRFCIDEKARRRNARHKWYLNFFPDVLSLNTLKSELFLFVSESTNNRVLFFSIFGMCCLLGLATWQVLYLRRFFIAKKLIQN